VIPPSIADPCVALSLASNFSLRRAFPQIQPQDAIFILPCGIRPVKDPLYLVDAISNWHESILAGKNSQSAEEDHNSLCNNESSCCSEHNCGISSSQEDDGDSPSQSHQLPRGNVYMVLIGPVLDESLNIEVLKAVSKSLEDSMLFYELLPWLFVVVK
jgi:hypothetical protein